VTHAPARGTTYQHDEAGNIPRIVGPLGSVTRQTFDALGRLASRALPNGATSTWPPSEVLYECDSSLRLTHEYHRSSAGEITQNLTYVYDAAAGGAVGATVAILGRALDCTR
jgi:YD repeat-containing protein